MKILPITALILAFFTAAAAQAPSSVLATANGQKFTIADLPEDVRNAFSKINETVAKTRSALLEGAIAQTLAELEAADRKSSVDKLFDDEISKKVAEPTEQEAKAFYETNQAALGSNQFEALKPRILAYLRQQAEDNLQKSFIEGLKAKYKPAMGKDVNSPGLKPTDVLVTLSGRTFIAKDFDERFKEELFEAQAQIYDAVRQTLEYVVFDALVTAEAKALKITPSDLIAKEITDKLKEFTPEERAGYESALRRVLFTKYKAQFSLKTPTPPKYDVATKDDPAQGPATAPVTVVMFSDFQCSSCAAAHPVLKKVIAEYGAKVRFIVRDFPLESIHAEAFSAAMAANAAAKQGKFFEFIDLLYANQKALDRDSLRAYARKIGLNMTQFEVDFIDPKAVEEIQQDQSVGVSVGVSGTPTIYINGVKLRDVSEEGLRAAIEESLPKAARPAKK